MSAGSSVAPTGPPIVGKVVLMVDKKCLGVWAESREQKQVPVKVTENFYLYRCDDVCSRFEDSMDLAFYRMPMVESLD